MKVLGILGSPRIGGNSDILLEEALRGARDSGAKTEKIILSEKNISGCLDCKKCNDDGICAIDDDMKEIHRMILDSNTIIHSVPLYFWAMTSQMKAYLDRWCAFFDSDWRIHDVYVDKFKGKRIGVITVCGDLDVRTADPIVHSFKMTCNFMGLRWLGVVQASATEKGEVSQNEKVKKEAYNLGKKGGTP